MRCSSVADRLAAFVDGELPQASAERIKAHLAHCPACTVELEEVSRVQRLATTWAADGSDVWNSLRGEIDPPQADEILELVRALETEVRALRAEVATLRSAVNRPQAPSYGARRAGYIGSPQPCLRIV